MRPCAGAPAAGIGPSPATARVRGCCCCCCCWSLPWVGDCGLRAWCLHGRRRRRPSSRPHHRRSREGDAAHNLRPGSWVQRSLSWATQGHAGHRAGPSDQGRAGCAPHRPSPPRRRMPRQASRNLASGTAAALPVGSACELARIAPRRAPILPESFPKPLAAVPEAEADFRGAIGRAAEELRC